MNQECQNKLYEAAIALADIASSISKSYFRSELLIETKAGNYPVTVADYKIEEAIRNWLKLNYPNHGIIGEEFSNHTANCEYTWIIDPIDGTSAFSTGKPTFTTLIALLKDNVPILGVIDQPILNERYVGISGKGSWLNTNTLNTSKITTVNMARLNATTPFMFNPHEYLIFNKLVQQVKLCSWGGDAYAYAALAAGHIDIIMEADLKYYDVAALIPLIQSSGGVISSWQGNPITPDFDGRCLASANQELHQAVLNIINN